MTTVCFNYVRNYSLRFFVYSVARLLFSKITCRGFVTCLDSFVLVSGRLKVIGYVAFISRANVLRFCNEICDRILRKMCTSLESKVIHEQYR